MGRLVSVWLGRLVIMRFGDFVSVGLLSGLFCVGLIGLGIR